jgi:hypothetical protein
MQIAKLPFQRIRQFLYRLFPFRCYRCQKQFRKDQLTFDEANNKYILKKQCCDLPILEWHVNTLEARKDKADCEIIDINSRKAQEQRLNLANWYLSDFIEALPRWERVVKEKGLLWEVKTEFEIIEFH